MKKCRPVVKEPSGGTLLFRCALPARGASLLPLPAAHGGCLCLGAACTGCIQCLPICRCSSIALPRRCLHGVHRRCRRLSPWRCPLPRRCLHGVHLFHRQRQIVLKQQLCLGAACTGCIQHYCSTPAYTGSLPRRCLHGVHRQKPTNCGTPFCSIRRESVDSFSEINNKDSCADYFPALFCCQGDLHHHYRQPRTDNRPVLRCEQHRLFLFILSSHYRRLL